MSKRLMTAKEVAKETGLKLSRVYQLSREGKIPMVVIGDRQYVYPEARILAWLGIAEDTAAGPSEVTDNAQK